MLVQDVQGIHNGTARWAANQDERAVVKAEHHDHAACATFEPVEVLDPVEAFFGTFGILSVTWNQCVILVELKLAHP